MANTSLVAPRTWVEDYAGACLRYSQSFFGAPVMYDAAWDSWEATKMKFGPNVPLPKDVPVLLWYSHWGTYYSFSKGVYEYRNWGHVTPYIPGDAIYTSPASGYGFERWSSINQIESRFNSKYVGWSLDINGLQVSKLGASPAPKPNPPSNTRKRDNVTLYYTTANHKPGNGGGGKNPTYYLAGDSPGTSANWLPTKDLVLAGGWARAHGDAIWLARDTYLAYKKAYLEPLKTR